MNEKTFTRLESMGFNFTKLREGSDLFQKELLAILSTLEEKNEFIKQKQQNLADKEQRLLSQIKIETQSERFLRAMFNRGSHRIAETFTRDLSEGSLPIGQSLNDIAYIYDQLTELTSLQIDKENQLLDQFEKSIIRDLDNEEWRKFQHYFIGTQFLNHYFYLKSSKGE